MYTEANDTTEASSETDKTEQNGDIAPKGKVSSCTYNIGDENLVKMADKYQQNGEETIPASRVKEVVATVCLPINTRTDEPCISLTVTSGMKLQWSTTRPRKASSRKTKISLRQIWQDSCGPGSATRMKAGHR